MSEEQGTDVTHHATATMIGGEWIHQDGDHTTLKITRCRACEGAWFPPRPVCSTCMSSDVDEVLTATRGTAYASTVVRIGPAAFRPPYVLSYVDISGVRILAHVDSDTALDPDTPVQLRVGSVGSTENGELTSYLVAEAADDIAAVAGGAR